MPNEQASRPAQPDSTAHATAMLAPWGHLLAVTAAAVFAVSSAFPAAAAVVRDTESWPKWWGVLDVAIAFVLAALAFAVIGLTQSQVTKQAEEASYRAYRVLIHGVIVMLAVFVLLGDRIVWANCLPGFAWRAWLLFYSLPAWYTLIAVGASRGR